MRTMFYKMLPPRPMDNVWEVNIKPEMDSVAEPRPHWWVPDEEEYPLNVRGGLAQGYDAQAIECWDYSEEACPSYEYRVLTPPVLPQT